MDSEYKIINGDVAVDDRGSLRFVNDFNFDGVKRFYQVENHRQNFIRAWHGHRKEGKYVWVSSGSALVGAAPMQENGTSGLYLQTELKKVVLSAMKPRILYIPPGYFNGFRNLEEGTRVIFFSTSTMEESKGDDIRLPYNFWDIATEDFR